MMNRFLKQNNRTTLFDKILFVTGFLIAAALPLYAKLSSVLLFVLILMILISRGKLIFKKGHISSFSWSATTVLLFLIPIIAVLFSDSIYDSTRVIGKHILYLLVPLTLICLSDKERKIGLNVTKKGLVAGAVIASIIMFINLSVQVLKNPEPFQLSTVLNYHHTYYNFTSIINKHPTYIGAEIFLAIVFLYKYLIAKSKLASKIIGYVCLSILILSLVFINSRVVLTLLILFILFAIVRFVFKLFQSKSFISLTIFLLSSIVICLLAYRTISNTYVFHRYTHELSWELSAQKGTKVNATVSSDSRMVRWQSALSLIKEKWLVGHGNNSEKRELYKQYEHDGLVYAMESRYDAHNMYLSYFIEYGVWGLLLFLLFILSNSYQSIKKRDFDRIFLILTISIIGLSENYFKSSEGIILISVFVNLLVLSNKKPHSKGNLLETSDSI